MRLVGASLSLAALVALAPGCGGGIYHTVSSGENLYRIGKAYGIAYQELADINAIEPPYRLEVGDEIFVPGADRRLPVRIITPSAVAPAGSGSRGHGKARTAAGAAHAGTPRTRSTERAATSGKGRDGFSWPAAGKITSKFGPRERGHHDGVDISAPAGSSVRAARAGKVIFSDKLSGYGNVLIVEHEDGFTTVYAHNERNLAKKGAWVKVAQRIATVGKTGHASGAHLHFEVRRWNVARDPRHYLPER